MSEPKFYEKALEFKQKYTVHSASDIIHLNVGGVRFSISLFLLFSVDDDGAIFIDRDGNLFAHVLQFLRDGHRSVLPLDECVLNRLKREAEFYQLPELVTEVKYFIKGLATREEKKLEILQAIQENTDKLFHNTLFARNGAQ